MIPGYTGHRPSPLDRDESHKGSGPRKQIPGILPLKLVGYGGYVPAVKS